jgi:hypothetical protein
MPPSPAKKRHSARLAIILCVVALVIRRMRAPQGSADPSGTSFTVMSMNYVYGTADVETEFDQFVGSNGAAMDDPAPMRTRDAVTLADSVVIIGRAEPS